MNFGTLILSLKLSENLDKLNRDLGIAYQETARLGFGGDEHDMTLMVDRTQELHSQIDNESAAFSRIAARA